MALYKQQRNNVTGMRRKSIRELLCQIREFLSKCKPGASANDCGNIIGIVFV